MGWFLHIWLTCSTEPDTLVAFTGLEGLMLGSVFGGHPLSQATVVEHQAEQLLGATYEPLRQGHIAVSSLMMSGTAY